MLPGYLFDGGLEVSFRLNIFSGKVLLSYSEIDLYINGPPTGGSITVSPQNGSALLTTFQFQTTDWISEDSDLPLTYEFTYEIIHGSTIYYIQTRSDSNFASSTMPAGLQSNDYAVFITATAYDLLLASGNIYTKSYIRPSTNINYEDYVKSNLLSLSALQDTDKTLAAINAVSSTMNFVDCSMISDDICSSFNRLPCSTVPNTCSSCLDGYSGIIGSSNTKCFSNENPGKAVGEFCGASNECIYNLCENGVCIAPVQVCPSSISDTVCSNNGYCI